MVNFPRPINYFLIYSVLLSYNVVLNTLFGKMSILLRLKFESYELSLPVKYRLGSRPCNSRVLGSISDGSSCFTDHFSFNKA